MSVSLIASLLLLQSMPGIVQQRTPELDAANDCLIAKTNEWLQKHDWHPADAERWRWATKIVEKCASEVEASALSISEPGNPVMQIYRSGAEIRITNHQLRKAEALYYVDGIIRDRFPPKAENSE